MTLGSLFDSNGRDGRMKRTGEIVVDNFAGGGGASTGIEMAIGRSVDIAINHDPAAIALAKTVIDLKEE